MYKIILLIISLYCCCVSNAEAQSYEDLVNRSADYIEAKDYVAAEQVLKTALRKEPANPGNVLLLSNLGTIQRHLEKYDDALLSYNVALTKYPTSVTLLHNRAALYCEMDSLNKALKDYNSILLIEEDDREALYRRGLIYMEKQDLFSAEKDFETITALNPKDINGQQGIALILKKRNEWEKAEEMYTNLIYENKTNPDLYLHRAECYLEMKKLARAQNDLDKAASYGNKTPFLHILKGQLRLKQYDKYAAKDEFLKAKELGADKIMIEELLKFCN